MALALNNLKAWYAIKQRNQTKPEIFKSWHLTSTNTVDVLNERFSRFNAPKTLFSDNGIQFTGREFKYLCTYSSIDYIATSIYHSRSNGQAERFINTFKRALRKNQDMDTDERSIQKFLWFTELLLIRTHIQAFQQLK